MNKATICVHCGKAIEHPADPDEIRKIHKIMIKHEMRCPKNPLVIGLRKILKNLKANIDKECHYCNAENFPTDKEGNVVTNINSAFSLCDHKDDCPISLIENLLEGN